MTCNKYVGMESVPTYVNFGLRKRFRKVTLMYVGNYLYSAATTMQAIHFLLRLDYLHCDYFHLKHVKHFTRTLSLIKKQISSNKCGLHIQRCTAIRFTYCRCGCWKMEWTVIMMPNIFSPMHRAVKLE
jgi:hypothetical protein